ncbi:MAG: nitric oxide synthase [Aliifodinibius sp.]|nr:flavodoxin family protein [Fodinibius sp.]NIV15894.1 nitric oxide synthase [Fodinibius sp.]NIY29846.1 nitric oxide synthase [Fodinibius sp.]
MSGKLVVYDSYFGNTEKIAQEIGKTLGDDVPVKRPSDVQVKVLSELDYLIVGAPTRAFRPSDAIKDFLKNIPSGSLKGVRVAAFDTRIDPEDVGSTFLKIMVRLFGYAAEPIAKSLVKKGGELVGAPAGFVVLDSEGPLKEGELERSVEWGESLLI